MNCHIIDTSGWIEYWKDGPNANIFGKVINNKRYQIIIPAIVVYEGFKTIFRECGEDIALQMIAQLYDFQLEPLNADIAIQAAKISCENKIPMADSIICATAQKFNAIIWTQDEHFKVIPKVKYFKKKK